MLGERVDQFVAIIVLVAHRRLYQAVTTYRDVMVDRRRMLHHWREYAQAAGVAVGHGLRLGRLGHLCEASMIRLLWLLLKVFKRLLLHMVHAVVFVVSNRRGASLRHRTVMWKILAIPGASMRAKGVSSHRGVSGKSRRLQVTWDNCGVHLLRQDLLIPQVTLHHGLASCGMLSCLLKWDARLALSVIIRVLAKCCLLCGYF